jgi:UDP-glucose 4-epimerase
LDSTHKCLPPLDEEEKNLSMNILITGSSGFIGRNLNEQLSRKYSITAPSSSQLNLLDAYAVQEYLKKESFDIVIHSATWNATNNSPKDTSKVLENNLRMFFNIARCNTFYCKMIYYGSGAEYDRNHWIPRMKEDYFDTHVPADDYGFSKYIMAKYAVHSKNIYNLRLFAVFGKYEDWQIRFISNACCKAMWDLPITIRQNRYFDYLHVDDLIKITEWFVENESKDRCYNVCTGSPFDLVTLAKKALGVSNKKLDIKVAGKGLGKEYSGDNSSLLKEMDGYVFKDITDCISELYHWYRVNKNKINRGSLLFDK